LPLVCSEPTPEPDWTAWCSEAVTEGLLRSDRRTDRGSRTKTTKRAPDRFWSRSTTRRQLPPPFKEAIVIAASRGNCVGAGSRFDPDHPDAAAANAALERAAHEAANAASPFPSCCDAATPATN